VANKLPKLASGRFALPERGQKLAGAYYTEKARQCVDFPHFVSKSVTEWYVNASGFLISRSSHVKVTGHFARGRHRGAP